MFEEEAVDARLEARGLFCRYDKRANKVGALAAWQQRPACSIVTDGWNYIVQVGVRAVAEGWYAVAPEVLEEEIGNEQS